MQNTNKMKPIKTVYNGCRFRSRLEARWAVFFDALGVEWEYEPEGFRMEDGTLYLPDFYLPSIDTWIEVKGVMSEADEHKIEQFRRSLKNGAQHIVVGPIPPEFGNSYDLVNWVHKISRDEIFFDVGCCDGWDFPYLPCVCPLCGKFGFEFDGRGARVCGHNPDNDKDYTADAPEIKAAYRKARMARFEHGENG